MSVTSHKYISYFILRRERLCAGGCNFTIQSLTTNLRGFSGGHSGKVMKDMYECWPWAPALKAQLHLLGQEGKYMESMESVRQMVFDSQIYPQYPDGLEWDPEHPWPKRWGNMRKFGSRARCLRGNYCSEESKGIWDSEERKTLTCCTWWTVMAS